jgi:hypothetical protein
LPVGSASRAAACSLFPVLALVPLRMWVNSHSGRLSEPWARL